MTRRHQGQPARQLAPRRRRQAFYESLAIVALGKFRRDQQVAIAGVAVFERRPLPGGDDFGVQSRPSHEAALDDVTGRETRVAVGCLRARHAIPPSWWIAAP